ncbi:hypothetical protein A1O1_08667 [Capronia coronata CBS 617.96]|uniref:Uncharacterized protein n=1 Tax=Capronia coronata CBS 617.96 TaxID=1182541 RepID=W9XU50_9EURO|nr:uncharacterized protein A1O1_08667 [Capronia coronata CBS 617.96]EXJ80521.1 hypothetical protein A1O1_08667 [Capronia coronata CBS 617.96]
MSDFEVPQLWLDEALFVHNPPNELNKPQQDETSAMAPGSPSHHHPLPPSPTSVTMDLVEECEVEEGEVEEGEVEDVSDFQDLYNEVCQKWFGKNVSMEWIQEQAIQAVRAARREADSTGDETESEVTESEATDTSSSSDSISSDEEEPGAVKHTCQTYAEWRAYLKELQLQMDRDKSGETLRRFQYTRPPTFGEVIAAERTKAVEKTEREARNADRRERRERRERGESYEKGQQHQGRRKPY